jgi:hypothetical protein
MVVQVAWDRFGYYNSRDIRVETFAQNFLLLLLLQLLLHLLQYHIISSIIYLSITTNFTYTYTYTYTSIYFFVFYTYIYLLLLTLEKRLDDSCLVVAEGDAVGKSDPRAVIAAHPQSREFFLRLRKVFHKRKVAFLVLRWGEGWRVSECELVCECGSVSVRVSVNVSESVSK